MLVEGTDQPTPKATAWHAITDYEGFAQILTHVAGSLQ